MLQTFNIIKSNVIIGTFVRVVDAVKGPFSPSLAPFPTYKEEILIKDTNNINYQDYQVFAPMAATDRGIFKAPDNPL